MKKLFLAFTALVMMLSVAAKAEPLPPDEFGEMKWGASKADVKAVMLEYTNEALSKLAPPEHPEAQTKGEGL
jgi:hypothetical protein